MYDLYTEYLNTWAQFGGLMVLYTNIRRFDQWSSYGLLERWDLPLSDAPKYRAVVDFLQTSAQPAPNMTLSTTTLDFGGVEVGAANTLSVTVMNTGTGVLTISEVRSDEAVFVVVSSLNGVTIGPGESATVDLQFEPQAGVGYGGSLTVVSDDPNSATVQISLLGAGFQPRGLLQVSVDTLDFGGVAVGKTDTLGITLANQGAGPLTIQDIQSDESAFVVLGEVQHQVLAANENMMIVIRFEPQDSVGYGESLRIVSDDPDRAEVRVVFLGAGFQPQVSVDVGQAVVGDFDGDGQVGFADFLLFAAAFGGTDPQFDLTGDGVVSFPDFLIFGQAYAASKPVIVASN